MAHVLAQCYWTRVGGKQRNRNSLGDRSPILASRLSVTQLTARCELHDREVGQDLTRGRRGLTDANIKRRTLRKTTGSVDNCFTTQAPFEKLLFLYAQ